MSILSLIPDSYKVPGVSIQVDPSQAGTPVNLKPGLLVGHRLGGTFLTIVQDFVPVAVGKVGDAIAFFGQGSQLARMCAVWLAINPTQILYAASIPEVSAGVAATGQQTITAGPTASGVYSLYVAGQSVLVGLLAGQTVTQVAAAIVAAVNADLDLPVTAAATAGVVTYTARWKGLTGNDVRIEDSILGTYGGQVLPTGMTFTYPSNNVLAGGAGVPDLSGMIAALGDNAYKFLGSAFTDTGAFTLLDAEYGFTASGRWGPVRQLYGQCFAANRDTYSNLMVLGPTRNSAVISPLAIELQSPAPTWEWSAAYTATAAQALTADPARPLQTLRLSGILPAPANYRFNKTQLNALAQSGFAIQGTNLDGANDGVPAILREQTEYQRNSYGMADNALELVTTLSTLDEVFTRLRQAISSKYPRHKLASNGTAFGPGQPIVTPNILKAELVAEYVSMEYDGLVDDLTDFKNNLIVQRSTVNPSGVDCIYPPELIAGLRRFNVLAQFRLLFPQTSSS